MQRDSLIPLFSFHCMGQAFTPVFPFPLLCRKAVYIKVQRVSLHHEFRNLQHGETPGWTGGENGGGHFGSYSSAQEFVFGPLCTVALARVIGLAVVALLAGFFLHHFIFTPSCNQVRNVIAWIESLSKYHH